MKEIIFIRHGQAESNVGNPKTSKVGSDLPLTAEGISQVKATAARLALLAIEGVIAKVPSVIHTSPYRRTMQTAEIIAQYFNDQKMTIEIQKDFRLREIQKGDWHGMTVADVLPLEGAIPATDRPTFRPPNIKNESENWFDVADRMESFIADTIDRGDTTLLIVSHDHPIELAITKLIGNNIASQRAGSVDNGSVSLVREQQGLWQIDSDYYNLAPPFTTE